MSKKNDYLRRLYTRKTIKIDLIVVLIYEVIKNGTHAQIFESLGDLSRLCFSSRDMLSQVCSYHYDKLRGDGHPTLFLLREGDAFFVVDVYKRRSGELDKIIRRLEDDVVWFAKHYPRIVVPRQNLTVRDLAPSAK